MRKPTEVSLSPQHETEKQRRFVVLEHDAPWGRHWDLMVEEENRLRTWALALPPDTPCLIPAEPLPHHRLEYLEHEGPVSGGRGQVRRWDKGTCQPLVTPDSSRTGEVYLLKGHRLQGQASFLPPTSPSTQWLFRLDPI